MTLGGTHVYARVSGELCEPAASRPSEGVLRVFVEFSPMAAPRFEAGAGRQQNEEELVEINRVMERCLKVRQERKTHPVKKDSTHGTEKKDMLA